MSATMTRAACTCRSKTCRTGSEYGGDHVTVSASRSPRRDHASRRFRRDKTKDTRHEWFVRKYGNAAGNWMRWTRTICATASDTMQPEPREDHGGQHQGQKNSHQGNQFAGGALGYLLVDGTNGGRNRRNSYVLNYTNEPLTGPQTVEPLHSLPAYAQTQTVETPPINGGNDAPETVEQLHPHRTREENTGRNTGSHAKAKNPSPPDQQPCQTAMAEGFSGKTTDKTTAAQQGTAEGG